MNVSLLSCFMFRSYSNVICGHTLITMHARILKFHNIIWIPHEKNSRSIFYFLAKLSPFLELCPYEKI